MIILHHSLQVKDSSDFHLKKKFVTTSYFVIFPLSAGRLSRNLRSSPLRWWPWTVSWSSRKWRRSWRRRGGHLVSVAPCSALHLRVRRLCLTSPDRGWLSGAGRATDTTSALCSPSEAAPNVSSPWPRHVHCRSIQSRTNVLLRDKFSTEVEKPQTGPEAWWNALKHVSLVSLLIPEK